MPISGNVNVDPFILSKYEINDKLLTASFTIALCMINENFS